jgi:hypothetical protein
MLHLPVHKARSSGCICKATALAAGLNVNDCMCLLKTTATLQVIEGPSPREKVETLRLRNYKSYVGSETAMGLKWQRAFDLLTELCQAMVRNHLPIDSGQRRISDPLHKFCENQTSGM